MIADSDAWTLIHVVIVIGIILMLGGIVAIRHSIDGIAEALARFGTYAETVGVTLGIATALAGSYTRWLGWVAQAAGVGSVGAGLVQAFTGAHDDSLILTIIGPTVISAWLFAMGILVGGRATRLRGAAGR